MIQCIYLHDLHILINLLIDHSLYFYTYITMYVQNKLIIDIIPCIQLHNQCVD